MLIKKWNKLPEEFKKDEIKEYYLILRKKNFLLLIKRLFDILFSLILICVLSPAILILSIAIKIDSKGPVFFRQSRVGQYGKTFRIFKFRTMVNNADKMGNSVTSKNDSRITKVGKFIRKCRLDEIVQLFDVLRGKMTFVGTRPEVKKYVDKYSTEMMATLLLPAGVTSEASVFFKDEDEILGNSSDTEEVYINKVLPEKMKYNLNYIKKFTLFRDVKIMFMTVFAVLGVKFKSKD